MPCSRTAAASFCRDVLRGWAASERVIWWRAAAVVSTETIGTDRPSAASGAARRGRRTECEHGAGCHQRGETRAYVHPLTKLRTASSSVGSWRRARRCCDGAVARDALRGESAARAVAIVALMIDRGSPVDEPPPCEALGGHRMRPAALVRDAPRAVSIVVGSRGRGLAGESDPGDRLRPGRDTVVAEASLREQRTERGETLPRRGRRVDREPPTSSRRSTGGGEAAACASRPTTGSTGPANSSPNIANETMELRSFPGELARSEQAQVDERRRDATLPEENPRARACRRRSRRAQRCPPARSPALMTP